MRHPLRKARAWILARLLPKGVTTAQVTQTLDAIRRERVMGGGVIPLDGTAVEQFVPVGLMSLLCDPRYPRDGAAQEMPARSRLTRSPHLSRVAAAQYQGDLDTFYGSGFVTDDGTLDRLIGLSD